MELSPTQLNSLNLFREITQVDDVDICRQVLESNSWNVDRAVDIFLTGGTHSSEPTSHIQSDGTGSSAESLETDPLVNNDSSSQSLLQMISSIVFRSSSRPTNIREDTVNFIRDFQLEYGSRHPVFFSDSYQAAARESFNSSRHLLIYLHSPLHEDNDKFCSQVICSQEFCEFSHERNFNMWIGNVCNVEGYVLSQQLGVQQYPFLALTVCLSTSKLQVIDRVQGFCELPQIINRIDQAIRDSMDVVNRNQEIVQERNNYTSLREEQDREYYEAEQQARLEREEREREEEMRLQREHEEQQSRELEEAIELSKKLQFQSMIEQKQKEFTEEPAAGPMICTLRLQMPHDIKITRRFLKSDSIQKLYDFVLVKLYEDGQSIQNVVICKNYPKEDLTNYGLSLEEAGLFPRGALFVHDLDA